MDDAVRAESFCAAEDGCACAAHGADFLEDGFVEGLGVMAIGFADENAKQDAGGLGSHA